eukprot:296489_1
MEYLKNEKYHAFLSSVHEQYPNDYPEIDVILQRAACVESACADLMKRQEVGTRSMESLRDKYSRFIKEQTNANLNLNNEIARLQKELEMAESRSGELEMEMVTNMKHKSSRTRELSEIMMAIENLYARSTGFSKDLKHSVADIQQLNPSESKTTNSQAIPGSEAAKKEEEEHEIQKILADMSNKLDVVANYVLDYQAIINESKQVFGEARANVPSPRKAVKQ